MIIMSGSGQRVYHDLLALRRNGPNPRAARAISGKGGVERLVQQMQARFKPRP